MKKQRAQETSKDLSDIHMSAIVSLPPPMVDVIIPVYNYANTIVRAIKSVKAQNMSNFACYIVNDGSTDETEQVVLDEIRNDARFHYIHQDNSGVAIARNHGVFSGVGKYVCCLDADDALAPEFLEVCVDALEKDRTVSIVYTGLWYIKGTGEQGLSPWPGDSDYNAQLEGKNQIPTCNVARREVWERLGGQRSRYSPYGAGEEDAEMWLRAGAYGFKAKKVTEAGLFLYSWMTGRVSGNKQHQMTDYRQFHPWTRDKQHPFASLATPEKYSHPVRQYDNPIISVVIPVGPNHSETIIDALDSLESQTFRGWEVVVADDTKSDALEKLINRTYPYAHLVKTTRHGAGAARNAGAREASAKFLVFLDADDWLHPDALEKMLQGYEKENAVIYTDHFGKAIMSKDEAQKLGERLLSYNDKNGTALFKHGWKEFDCALAQRQPNQSMYHWCLVTTLLPKAWHDEIRGFDEDMDSWEDWDYYIRISQNGHCFARIPEGLVIYRYYTGNRREDGLKQYPDLIKYMINKYKGKEIMACGCSGNKTVSIQQSVQIDQRQRDTIMTSSDEDFVLIKYTHPNLGQHKVMGPATGINYGYRAGGEMFLVNKQDIKAQPVFFQVVQKPTENTISNRPAAPTPAPAHIVRRKRIGKSAEDRIVEEDRFDLQTVAGISSTIAQGLNSAGVYTLDDLISFGEERLVTVKGVGQKRAAAIIASAIQMTQTQ